MTAELISASGLSEAASEMGEVVETKPEAGGGSLSTDRGQAVIDRMLEEYLRTKWTSTHIAITVFMVLGIFINGFAALFLHRKNSRSMFTRLLKTLVVSDLVVNVTCGLMWGIPRGENYFSKQIFPHLVPIVYPISHMAVLTSNYCTGVMGFERFVRLRYTCNFKPRSWITSRNLNYYRLAIIIFPILFYAPKFFELRSVRKDYDCMIVVQKGTSFLRKLFHHIFIANHLNVTLAEHLGRPGVDPAGGIKPGLVHNVLECIKRLQQLDNGDGGELGRNLTYYTFESTDLRKDWTYYNVYFMGFNIIVGYLIPFIFLVIVNIVIVVLLRRRKLESGRIFRQSTIRGRGDRAEATAGNGNSISASTASATATAGSRWRSRLNISHSFKLSSASSASAASLRQSQRNLCRSRSRSPMPQPTMDAIAEMSSGGGGGSDLEQQPQKAPPRKLTAIVRRSTCPGGQCAFRKKARVPSIHSNKCNGGSGQQPLITRDKSLEVSAEAASGSTSEEVISPGTFGLESNEVPFIDRNSTGLHLAEQVTVLLAAHQLSDHQDLAAVAVGNCAANCEDNLMSEVTEVATVASEKRPFLTQLSAPIANGHSLGAGAGVGGGRSASFNSVRWKLSPTTASTPSPTSSSARRPQRSATINDPESRASGNQRHVSTTSATSEAGGGGQDGLVRHGGTEASVSSETKLTWISTSIIFLFIFCHFWKLIPTIYEAINYGDDGQAIPEWPEWLNTIKDLSHILVMLNSAINFLPYLLSLFSSKL